jgi:hypothetical protein
MLEEAGGHSDTLYQSIIRFAGLSKFLKKLRDLQEEVRMFSKVKSKDKLLPN